MTELLLEIQNLKKHFPILRGAFRATKGTVKAVDGVSFSISRGETLGLVGESGCGKTTTGNCILRIIEPDDGVIRFHEDGNAVDIRSLDTRQLRTAWRNMQMIFQDPYTSLDPRMTLKQIVGEPLIEHKIARGKALDDQVAHLLQIVGLRPEYMSRYPHAFSGGQRQRIGIARSLALNPKFIVCDEPVSALDVSIQAQILNLLQDLQSQLSLTYLFVAHNLSVIKHISNRVAVMYVGKIVELAETEAIFANPKHPYTEALISAVPKPDPLAVKNRIVLPGEVASPANPPSGCYFNPRCKYAQKICTEETPELKEISPGHLAACHFVDQLSLAGLDTYLRG
jgi:peptide/nickel transport system ATP-binding protein